MSTEFLKLLTRNNEEVNDKNLVEHFIRQRSVVKSSEIRWGGHCGSCASKLSKSPSNFKQMNCKKHRYCEKCEKNESETECVFCKCDLCERVVTDKTVFNFDCKCLYHIACLPPSALMDLSPGFCPFCSPVGDESRCPLPTIKKLLRLSRDETNTPLFFSNRQLGIISQNPNLTPNVLLECGIPVEKILKTNVYKTFFLYYFFDINQVSERKLFPMIMKKFTDLTFEDLLESRPFSGTYTCASVASLVTWLDLNPRDLVQLGVNWGTIESWGGKSKEDLERIYKKIINWKKNFSDYTEGDDQDTAGTRNSDNHFTGARKRAIFKKGEVHTFH